jgi:hypothetical protein
MAIVSKVESLDRSILFAPREGLSPQDISRMLADAAREAINEASDQNTQALGHRPTFRTFVDGTQGAPLDAVKPDGTIVAEFDLGTEVIQYVFDLIVANSPRLTGAFVQSQRIYADGVEVQTPEDAVGADEVVITSVAPYARKIERGQSKRKAPNGVYEATAAMARQRFGNVAQILFRYRTPIGGGTALDKWAVAHSARTEAKPK